MPIRSRSFAKIVGALVALYLTAVCSAPVFGGSVYRGRPELQTMLALVIAGGGPADYKTTTLIGVLADPGGNAEVAKLTKQYGAPTVKGFITTFDFVVADALRLLKKNGTALPATPAPDPKDGKALSAALYAAGVDKTSGKYDVTYMLDRLVSHSLHVQIMKDIDAKYGARADAVYKMALLQLMQDLKAKHSLYVFEQREISPRIKKSKPYVVGTACFFHVA